jgi:hypothetical protein
MEEFEGKQSEENEEAINNGLGILVHKKFLFHGSSRPNIESFIPAEETTVGEGVYLTSSSEDATGYAHGRVYKRQHQERVIPTLYRCEITEVRLLDLRNDENVVEIMKQFREVLISELRSAEVKAWYVLNSINDAIELIDQNKINSGNVQYIARPSSQLFTNFIKSLGYDGLITWEGGEPGHFANHETYVIFDPSKVSITEKNDLK